MNRREFLVQFIGLLAFASGLNSCRFHNKKTMIYKVDHNTCIGCQECFSVCKHHAISLLDKKAFIDPQKCHGCGDCAELCKRKAIVLLKT